MRNGIKKERKLLDTEPNIFNPTKYTSNAQLSCRGN